MPKLKIALGIFDDFPFALDSSKIQDWKSDIFTFSISGPIHPKVQKRTEKEEYSDEYFRDTIQSEYRDRETTYDYVLLITNYPLEKGWTYRVLDRNAAVISLRRWYPQLKSENIPIENAMLALIYFFSLIYKRFGCLRTNNEVLEFEHISERGCIFDLNFSLYLCDHPFVCQDCRPNYDPGGVACHELGKIRKHTYYRFSDTLKQNIYLSLFATFWFGVIASVGANMIMNVCNNESIAVILILVIGLAIPAAGILHRSRKAQLLWSSRSNDSEVGRSENFRVQRLPESWFHRKPLPAKKKGPVIATTLE